METLKKRIRILLQTQSLPRCRAALRGIPEITIINTLFSFLYDPEELTKWRAVTLMGRITSALAGKNMEAARIVMRRLMWSLNEESGGIGWGAPEAMGEIMYHNRRLAVEYHKILISYVMPEANYIELEMLQRGVLWAIARLADKRPRLMGPAVPYLRPYMISGDPYLKAFAAWAAGALKSAGAAPVPDEIFRDRTELTVYIGDRIARRTVGEVARGSRAEF